MIQKVDLLELAMSSGTESYSVPEVDILRHRLVKSGSTWEIFQPQGKSKQDLESVLLAATDDGTVYCSTLDIGLPEYMSSVLVRKKIERGCSVSGARIVDSSLTGHQFDVATLVINNPVSVMSGFPGTGKTTTSEAVHESLVKSGKHVGLCSFMGSAASRLGEAVGSNSSTIHRLLEYDGERFNRNRDNRLSFDSILIDEAGTLSAALDYQLLSALRDDCQVIYIGDPYQLPSIEPGNVLMDLSESVPHGRLVEIIRTDPDGPIGLASIDVFNGVMPTNSERGKDGFFFLPREDDKLISSSFSIHERLCVNSQFSAIRCLAPTNDLCRQYNEYCLEHINTVFPVVCKQNNRQLGIFNGDFGTYNCGFAFFEKNGEIIKVRFSDGFGMGWAMGVTVHKMQGKECDNLVYMCPRYHGGLPRRCELYTALTRSKSKFVGVGCPGRFEKMVKDKTSHRRITLRSKFIAGKARIIQQPVATEEQQQCTF